MTIKVIIFIFLKCKQDFSSPLCVDFVHCYTKFMYLLIIFDSNLVETCVVYISLEKKSKGTSLDPRPDYISFHLL